MIASSVDPKCPLCGGARSQEFIRDGKFAIRTCMQCAFKFTAPQPTEEELREIYSESYFKNDDARSMAYDDYASEEKEVRDSSNARLDRIEKILGVRGGSVLDIGCAMGFFLATCEDRGFKAHGVELSEYCREHFVAKNAEVHWGLLETAPFKPASFDLITLWDVIEHLPDPAAALRKCAELAKPGAGIVLMTPNIDSAIAKVMGKKWVCYEDPHVHLSYYGVEHIKRELERCGFTDVVVKTFWHGGKRVPLKLVFERLGTYLPPLSPVLKSLERSRAGALTAYLDAGDNMVVYARKA